MSEKCQKLSGPLKRHFLDHFWTIVAYLVDAFVWYPCPMLARCNPKTCVKSRKPFGEQLLKARFFPPSLKLCQSKSSNISETGRIRFRGVRFQTPNSQPQSITQKGVHTHPLTAREREHWFLQHLSHVLAANSGVNSANTLLCDTLALSQPNSVSFSGLTEFRGASSVSSFQPIICVQLRTHRVSGGTHRVSGRTQ